jgi:hypothetical protein
MEKACGLLEARPIASTKVPASVSVADFFFGHEIHEKHEILALMLS